MPTDAPKIDDTPGLIWRRQRFGWEARWQARTDLVERGFPIKSHRVWAGQEADLTPKWREYISDFCTTMQNEMLVWGRGGIEPAEFTGTIASLIACYRTDPDSTYHKLRYKSRVNYDVNLKRLEKDAGDTLLTDIKARGLLRWHEQWSSNGRVAMGHSMIAMLRSLFKFGKTILEDAECERLKGVLHDMRFPMPKPRSEIVTAEQVNAIREIARQRGLPSIALAQAFQFECALRQKDVIGEWVPHPEPGISDVKRGQEKWLCGLRWNEIDQNLILTHITSKRQKELVVDLKWAPMVMEELALAYPGFAAGRRELLPGSGPIIVSERTAVPYSATQFRRTWRILAKAVGVPAGVFNMDNRAGAISEATNSGAPLESVRHAATHSDIATTQRYSRDGIKKTADVQRFRVAGRSKNAHD
jgi:hypothetical protein